MAYCIPRRVTLRNVIAKNEQVRLANIVPMPQLLGAVGRTEDNYGTN